MIVGTGIDIVSVDRFIPWVTHNREYLAKIFTPHELSLFNKEMETQMSAKRCAAYVAVRFAAKEAFYKALSCALVQYAITGTEFGLLFACKHVAIVKETWGVPKLKVAWDGFEDKLGCTLPPLQSHLSLSHEREYACAHVILTTE